MPRFGGKHSEAGPASGRRFPRDGGARVWLPYPNAVANAFTRSRGRLPDRRSTSPVVTYVVAQLVLLFLVAFGPRTATSLPALTGIYAKAAMGFGIVLMAIAGGLVVTGIANLGRNLTPLPFPKDGGELVQTGAYSLVRHPVYSGVIALAVGWACAVRGPLTLAYALLLFLLLDAKSRQEERWLETKFPSYAEYRRRVRRLIPFVY
jgi:protein-S-isoprenylcysteine O-methyltransferase Ste14